MLAVILLCHLFPKLPFAMLSLKLKWFIVFFVIFISGSDSTSELSFFFFFNWLLSYALLLPSLQGYSLLKLPLACILPYLSVIIYTSNWPLFVSVCFKTVLFHSNEKQESLMLPESRLCFKLNCKPWIELILGKNGNCSTSHREPKRFWKILAKIILFEKKHAVEN